MKKSLWLIFLLLSCFFLHLPASFADKVSEMADKYYAKLKDADGTASLYITVEMPKEILPSEIQELYASIIDRGAKDSDGASAIRFVLSGLDKFDPKTVWSPHLERSILAQTKHEDLGVRAMIPEVLSTHDKVKYRELCLSYLDDPVDLVRYRAVDALRKWPDRRAILNKYIQDHFSTLDHAKSVEHAKLFRDN